MLFHSTLRKELARSFGATLVVLVTIVMTMTLIRTLGQANRGSVNPQEVMMVMGYTVLGYLPPSSRCACSSPSSARSRACTPTARWSSGSAPAAGCRRCCGRCSASPGRSSLGVAVLALVIWPWANQQTQELKDRYGSRGDLERVAPGPVPGVGQRRARVLPGQGHAGQQVGQEHLHLHRRTRQADHHVGAHRPGGHRRRRQFLLLSNGQRLENTLDGRQLKVSVFEELGNRSARATWARRTTPRPRRCPPCADGRPSR
jgi:lipopolysaccharide export system permease protein